MLFEQLGFIGNEKRQGVIGNWRIGEFNLVERRGRFELQGNRPPWDSMISRLIADPNGGSWERNYT
jgi:hypothetical protein